MPYELYKVIHFAGVLMLFASIGASLGTRIVTGEKHPWKAGTTIAHGVGLFLVLLGGFGMLARLGLTAGFPGWIWVKLIVWVALGAVLFAATKMAGKGKMLWIASIVLGILASYMAIYKPL